MITRVEPHVSRAIRREDLAAARTGNLARDEDAPAFGEDIVHDDPILHRVIPSGDEELVGTVVRLHRLFGLQLIGGALHIDVGGTPRPTPSLADLRNLRLKHGFVDLELIGVVARLYGAVEVDEVTRDDDGAARHPFAARRCLGVGGDGGRAGVFRRVVVILAADLADLGLPRVPRNIAADVRETRCVGLHDRTLCRQGEGAGRPHVAEGHQIAVLGRDAYVTRVVADFAREDQVRGRRHRLFKRLPRFVLRVLHCIGARFGLRLDADHWVGRVVARANVPLKARPLERTCVGRNAVKLNFAALGLNHNVAHLERGVGLIFDPHAFGCVGGDSPRPRHFGGVELDAAARDGDAVHSDVEFLTLLNRHESALRNRLAVFLKLERHPFAKPLLFHKGGKRLEFGLIADDGFIRRARIFCEDLLELRVALPVHVAFGFGNRTGDAAENALFRLFGARLNLDTGLVPRAGDFCFAPLRVEQLRDHDVSLGVDACIDRTRDVDAARLFDGSILLAASLDGERRLVVSFELSPVVRKRVARDHVVARIARNRRIGGRDNLARDVYDARKLRLRIEVGTDAREERVGEGLRAVLHLELRLRAVRSRAGIEEHLTARADFGARLEADGVCALHRDLGVRIRVGKR